MSQEVARTLQTLRESEQSLKYQVEELKAQRDDLKENLKKQGERNSIDKEQLHGEIILARQKQEETASEASHLKLSYDRVLQEKEILEQQVIQSKNEVNSFKAKVGALILHADTDFLD
jgi:chromosome segregation ATPase